MAVKHIEKKGILLVFPQENKRDPASLWYELHPRTKMRWEWDADGDQKVSDLWHLRERLSLSNKVVYSKWFRGRATLMSFDVFCAILRLQNPDLPDARGLTLTSREVLDLLEEDSPLSTKQLKKATGLQGREAEAAYQRALKELWERLLIVAYGEVDEGAFPSLAVGATRTIFEPLWDRAAAMTDEEAREILAEKLVAGSAFEKFWKSLEKKRAQNSNLRRSESENESSF
ncbi:MAG: hypothetical protein V4760_19595 [Bdellovibrionota bacterium]